ncbi:MAG: nuclear transport factor 2 family protein [Patulibacter minatonensis]
MSAATDLFAGSHDDLDTVLAFERRLADPSVRADREELLQLLHPDFEEVGRSGRHWHRDAIIDALVDDPGDGYDLIDLTAELLGPGVILATYAARAHDAEHAASRHSSIWVHFHGLWRVRYHQGTPVS